MTSDAPSNHRPGDDTVTHGRTPHDPASNSIDAGPPVVPGYEIVRHLHAGGQGVVYLAVQQSTRRKVALKVIHDRPSLSDATVKRFEREIELVAQFNHPNIVRVFDGGRTKDGRMYCVMEYVRGRPLTEYIREERLTPDAALQLFVDLAAAVGHAHRYGVVHRDLKPANILVDQDGVARVLDFGLAKVVGPGAAMAVSQTGEFLGTLRYSSPEQLRAQGDGVDVRADVYSLGVILYELLTGVSPYPETQHAGDWARFVLESDPTPPRRAWDSRFGVFAGESSHGSGARHCPIDRDLETIVMKALAKSRARRYANAAALAQDVDRYLRDEPIAARRDSPAYYLGSKARRWIARHVFVTSALIVALATAITLGPVAYLVFRQTEINSWYEGWMASMYPPMFAEPAFENVRVIGFDDHTDFEALAAGEQIEGVDRKVPRSWRRMHGRLMEKLTTTGCRAVVFDITFMGASEHDALFVQGVAALREAGIDVVVAVPIWWFDEPGLPMVSPNILPHVKYGSPMIRVGDAPYAVQLVAQRGLLDPQPSLALAAYAAARRPGYQFDIRLDEEREHVDLIYWRPREDLPAEKEWGPPPDRISLTRYTLGAVERGAFRDAFDRRWGLTQTDLLGFLHIDISRNDYLERSTISYEKAFDSSPSDLANRLEQRVVVVGDLRADSDTHQLADGRMVAACYAHASAIEQLMTGQIVRMIRPREEFALVAFCAACGAVIVVIGHGRRPISRVLALGALIVAVIACSIYAYAYWYYLYNPVLPVTATLIASIVCWWAARVRRVHVMS